MCTSSLVRTLFASSLLCVVASGPQEELRDDEYSPIPNAREEIQRQTRIVYANLHDHSRATELIGLEPDQFLKIDRMYQELQEQSSKLHADFREAIKGLPADRRSEAKEKFHKDYTAMLDRYADRVQEQVLTSEQHERLSQAITQSILGGQLGKTELYRWPLRMSEYLDLNPTAKESLLAATKEAREKYELAVEAAEKEALEHVLKLLPREKAREFRETVGLDE